MVNFWLIVWVFLWIAVSVAVLVPSVSDQTWPSTKWHWSPSLMTITGHSGKQTKATMDSRGTPIPSQHTIHRAPYDTLGSRGANHPFGILCIRGSGQQRSTWGSPAGQGAVDWPMKLPAFLIFSMDFPNTFKSFVFLWRCLPENSICCQHRPIWTLVPLLGTKTFTD